MDATSIDIIFVSMSVAADTLHIMDRLTPG